MRSRTSSSGGRRPRRSWSGRRRKGSSSPRRRSNPILRPVSRRFVRRSLATGAVVVLSVAALFVANGLWPSWRTPDHGTTGIPPAAGALGEIRIVAWNIAKGGVHLGGTSFRDRADLEAHLDRIAGVFRDEAADVVFLSEALGECGPAPVAQPEYLARAAGLSAWAFGENYSWGLPFYRIRNGVAILSRFPLTPVETAQLAGARPFWSPEGNRRILWVELDLDGRKVPAASIWNESFDPANNVRQTREILGRLGGRPALLAGDFNAGPGHESMRLYRESGLFTGEFEGAPTYPSPDPKSRIDYVLAPRDWTHVETRVLPIGDLSDHRPVVSVFRLPPP